MAKPIQNSVIPAFFGVAIALGLAIVIPLGLQKLFFSGPVPEEKIPGLVWRQVGNGPWKEIREEIVPTSSQTAKDKLDKWRIDIPIPLTEKEKNLVNLNKEVLDNIEKLRKAETNKNIASPELKKILDTQLSTIADLKRQLAAKSVKKKNSFSKDIARLTARTVPVSTAQEFNDKLERIIVDVKAINRFKKASNKRLMKKFNLSKEQVEKARLLYRIAYKKAYAEGNKTTMILNYTDINNISRKEKIHFENPQEAVDLEEILADDTFIIKPKATMKSVLKIWGEPKTKEIDDNYNGNIVWWIWGKYGRVKKVRFEDGLMGFWIIELNDMDCAYQREVHSVDKNVTPSSPRIVKGMNKIEVYKLWGGPATNNVIAMSHGVIQTTWYFRKKGDYEAYRVAQFQNNKLKTWLDRSSGNKEWQGYN